MLLRLAQDQPQLPLVLVLQRFSAQRARLRQVLGELVLVADAKRPALALAVQPLGLQRLDRTHHEAVDDLHAHAPVEDEGAVVEAARIKTSRMKTPIVSTKKLRRDLNLTSSFRRSFARTDYRRW